MSWALSALPLVVAAVAMLVVLPAVADGTAHAAVVEPGMIAVADRYNSSVAMFHSNGTFAFYLGRNSHFYPEGVAIAPDGRVYVADDATKSILAFHSNGTFAFPIGSQGYALGEFYRSPTGVAVGPDGRVVAVDDGHGRVQAFHSNGTFALDLGLGTGPPGPSGVAVGPDGRVYVAIRQVLGGGIVHVFHQNGTPAFDIGPDGVAGGTFNALDVAVGPDGRVYVLAVGSGDDYVGVHVFHPDGTPAFMVSDGVWCSDSYYYPGHGFPDGAGPGGYIAVGPDGRIVVACHTHDPQSGVNYTTHVLRPDGTFAFAIGSIPILHHGEISRPVDVAVGPDGRVYVVDSDLSNIRVFHPNGTFAFPFGLPEWGEGYSYGPCGIAFGPDGRVYVAESGHVQVFHPNGTFAFPFEPPGLDDAGYRGESCGIAVGPDGRIYVDVGNRVHVFQPDGPSTFAFDFALGNAFVSGGWFFHSPDIALGRDGLIYILGDGFRVFHPNGTRVPFTDPPPRLGGGDVAVGPDGRIYITGLGFSTVSVLHPNGTLDLIFGSHGGNNGQFRTPDGIAVGPDGRIYVADYHNGRVQVFHPNGTFALAMGEDWVGPGLVKSTTGIAVGPGLPPSLLPTPPANATTPPAQVTVVIEQSAPASPLNFTAAGPAANLTIDVAGLAGPVGAPLDGSASSTVTFPPSETTVVASFATVTFPPNVVAAHVPAGGRLALHVAVDVPDDARVQGALAYEGSGRVTLQRVVEVGAASGRVTFDMPVRILLEGQAGGRAFYIEGGADGGTITPIDQACAADDTARVHRHLGGAGECQMDSADGDKLIYTYHLTRFGTVMPVGAVPPPVVHTCSVGLGMPSLVMADVRPGGISAPVRQTVINSGSAPFARVDLSATAWRAGPSQGSGAPAPLSASATEISTEAAGGPYTALVNGTAVAHKIEGGGGKSPLWFMLNLTSHADARGGTLVQEVTYQATCRVP